MKVFMLNGYPGSGKDTFVEMCTELYPRKIMNIHTSTPVKQAMLAMGWNGEKTNDVRRVMSDLMAVSQSWKGPIRFVLGQLVGEPEIAFVHCREPHNIISYGNDIKKYYPGAEIKSVLVTRPQHMMDYPPMLSNSSDTGVMNHEYDHIIQNRGDLVMLKRWAQVFLMTMGGVKYELLQNCD